MDFYMNNHIDIIYLDIELGKLSGIDIGKKIREDMDDDHLQIVYISVSKDYLMELFSIRPNNFLLKPFTKEQIIESVVIAIKLCEKKEKLFKYYINGREIRVRISEIIYFESMSHKIKMVTKEEKIEFYTSMNDIYNQVKSQGFAMCHKSFVVNINHIAEYNLNELKISDGSKITVSRGKREEFMEQIARYDLNSQVI